MLSMETREQLSVKYSRKAPLRIAKKREFLVWLGLIGSSFLCFLPALGRYGREVSLLPIWFFAVLGTLWQLIFYLGHKVTPFQEFKELPSVKKRLLLLYDSFWYNLMRSGFGLYAFIALIWGVTELSLGEGQKALLVILLFFCVAFILFCFIKREWLVGIAIDGLQQHKGVRNAIAVIMSFIAIFPLFGGIARMAQVTVGRSALNTMVPFMLLSGTILALVIFVMAFLGTMITYAQYSQWKKRQNELKIRE